MELENKNKQNIANSVAEFDKTLSSIVSKAQKGIELDVNDENAFAQIVNTVRNADGTVNEEALAGFSVPMQSIIRAGVGSNVGKQSFTPKVTRIGGTNKSPTYGYRDPNQQKFVQTNSS